MSISVCIPTYNQSAYVLSAIESAYNQTLSPDEIIVYDDCSTDNTVEILQEAQQTFPILRIYVQPANVGIAKNSNACFQAAQSDFIVRLDSDDCLLPSYIERLAHALLEYPEAGYAHAQVQEIDAHSTVIRERILFRKTGFQTGDESVRASLKGYRVAANIIMFRRAALARVGFGTATTNFAEDYHLSVSLAAAGFGNVYIGERLAQYRVWDTIRGVSANKKLVEIIGLKEVFDDVLAPAFQVRGWPQQEIDSAKLQFACTQADCLGWPTFTEAEKEVLTTELYKLSDQPKLKRIIWMYRHSVGNLLTAYKRLRGTGVQLVKKLLNGQPRLFSHS